MQKDLVRGGGRRGEKCETGIAIKISKGQLNLKELTTGGKTTTKNILAGNGWYIGHEDRVLFSSYNRQAQLVTQPWISPKSSGPNNTCGFFSGLLGSTSGSSMRATLVPFFSHRYILISRSQSHSEHSVSLW